MTLQIKITDLFENGLHFGHRRTKLNPKMQKFIYDTRNNIDIFDLSQTAKKLVTTLELLHKTRQDGKNIIFVGTKPQAQAIIEDIAQATGSFFVSHKWLPGLLTNFDTIKTRLTYLEKLEKEAETGMWIENYTKKETAKKEKELNKLKLNFAGVRKMVKKPDLIFIIDTNRESNAVAEGIKLNIPVVAIVDSNSSPDGLTAFIPANDDSIAGLKYLAELIKQALA